ncbi:hypothetical protein ACIBJG_38190, partial [Streptomyces sp. NPDC050422]
EGTTALPENVLEGTDEFGNTVYLDRPGNVLKEDGTLKQHHSAAKPENVATGAETPATTLTPAQQPALVGAHTLGGNADGAIRMGDDLEGAGRAGDDATGTGTGRTPGGAANNLPGGSAGHHMPSNSLDGTSSDIHTGENRPLASGLPQNGWPTAHRGPTGAGTSNRMDPASGVPHGSGPLHPEGPGRGARGDGTRIGDDAAEEQPAPLDEGEASGAPDGNDVHPGDGPPATDPHPEGEPDYLRPALLPAEGPLTLRDVRTTRPTRTRWERGEEFHRQMWGGGAERHYPVPTSTDARYPVTASGGRKVDVPVKMHDGRTVAVEVKTYGPYRSITLRDGTRQAIRNEVPLSKHIREQIHKDLALRRMDPRYDPRWSFTHAGPSSELRAYLTQAKIIFLEYGETPKKN